LVWNSPHSRPYQSIPSLIHLGIDEFSCFPLASICPCNHSSGKAHELHFRHSVIEASSNVRSLKDFGNYFFQMSVGQVQSLVRLKRINRRAEVGNGHLQRTDLFCPLIIEIARKRLQALSASSFINTHHNASLSNGRRKHPTSVVANTWVPGKYSIEYIVQWFGCSRSRETSANIIFSFALRSQTKVCAVLLLQVEALIVLSTAFFLVSITAPWKAVFAPKSGFRSFPPPEPVA